MVDTHLLQLVDRLAGRLGDIADEMVAAYVEQIPEYGRLPTSVLDDVRAVSRHNLEVWLRVVREQRPATAEELAVFAASAKDRARAGLALEPLLHAYRLGGAVGWDATLRLVADGPPEQLAAGLHLAGWLMRYVDQVSTTVAQSYLDERELLVTAEERHHRQVADLLLSQGPTSAETEVRALAGRFRLATMYWVAHGTVSSHEHVRSAVHRLRRALPNHSPIAVPSERDLLLLWPHDEDSSLERLRGVVARLRSEGISLTLAVAGPAAVDLYEAHREATVVAGLAREQTGLVTLEDVALEALVHQVGGRTADVVRRLIAPLVTYEVGRSRELSSTLDAFLECGASVKDTAKRLMVHRNTVAHRLGRIRELTGLDPNQPHDLFLLYAATQLATPD